MTLAAIRDNLQWSMRRPSTRLLVVLASIPLLIIAFLLLRTARDFMSAGTTAMRLWWQGDEATRQALVVTQRDRCPGAPFILPADGFIGLLYADPRGPYSVDSPHQGIDIFSNSDAGVTPVYAAYDGYISREEGWRSTLIQRVPQDPLRQDRQIWLYYTHMADRQGNDFIDDAFPPGVSERFVEQGTLLGYTGDYNGNATRSVWVHLHFSIIRDDGSGHYTNELDFANSIDPSPYLGRAVAYRCEPDGECSTSTECIQEPERS
jgi:hypothetical protein